MRFLIFFALVTGSILLRGADFIEVKKDGTFRIDTLNIGVSHFSPVWKRTGLNEYNYSADKIVGGDGTISLDGIFKINKTSARLSQSFKNTSNSIEYDATISSEDNIPSEVICLYFELPLAFFLQSGISLNEQKFNFDPVNSGKTAHACRIKTASVPLPNGILQISCESNILHIQDNSQYNSQTVAFRLYFSKNEKLLKNDSIKACFKFVPYADMPVNLTQAVNMGLSDEEDGDHRGGWTDQGRGNDMRCLPTGLLTADGIEYRIIDENTNQGKSAIVLKGLERSYFPDEIKVDLTANDKIYRYIYILNACAWVKPKKEVGYLEVSYDDTSTDIFTFTPGVNTDNFWCTKTPSEASVAWSGENNSAMVALYATSFPLKAKIVKKLVFKSNGQSVWMIPAVSLSDKRQLMTGKDVVKSASDVPVVIQADKNWRPLRDKKIQSGSILDFSFLNDAPAGKYGQLIAKDADFVFEKRPGVPVKFWGTNLCMKANFPSEKNAVRIADDIARRGYNLVRIHHYDDPIANHSDASESTSLVSENVQKLDFLLGEFKKRGIYVTTDLYVSRRCKAGDISGYPEPVSSSSEFKMLFYCHPPALENLKRFSSNFLNHVNPYTGLAYKEDPMFVTINLINEDTLISGPSCRTARERNPFIKQRFEEMFTAYCKEHDLSKEPKFYNAFLDDLHSKVYQELKTFIRGIGCKILLADQNMCWDYNSAVMREQYDFVDNHAYWGHPEFLGASWQLPMKVAPQESIIRNYMGTFSSIAATQLLDKPFAVSEWCYVNPNPTNGEGSILTASYASLQGWDALNRFAYSHAGDDSFDKDQGAVACFDDFHVPVVRLGEQMGALLFRRGAIREAEHCFPILLERDFNKNHGLTYSSSKMRRLSMLAKLGMIIPAQNKPLELPQGTVAVIQHSKRSLGNIPAVSDSWDILQQLAAKNLLLQADLEKDIYVSSTGQMGWDVKSNTFVLKTEQSEAFVLAERQSRSAKVFQATAGDRFASLVVTAVDGLPLQDSGRILIVHLFDIKNTGQSFKDNEMSIVEKWGTSPQLARKNDIVLSTNRNLNEFSLYAIDFDGNRVKKLSFEGNTISLSNFLDDMVIAAYELVRN